MNAVLKIGAVTLFALMMPIYLLVFFGSASGGSSDPEMMYFNFTLVFCGVASGIYVAIRFIFFSRTFWFDWVAVVIAIWPVFWLAALFLSASIK